MDLVGLADGLDVEQRKPRVQGDPRVVGLGSSEDGAAIS